MSELMPCPFCGYGDLNIMAGGVRAAWGIWESPHVEFTCNKCLTETTIYVDITEEEEDLPDAEILELTKKRGIKKWNTRVDGACNNG